MGAPFVQPLNQHMAVLFESSSLALPAISVIVARFFGRRLEQFFHARQALVISSAEAMPPVWNVRMVSWVPGSPMLSRGNDAHGLAHFHAGSPLARLAP